MKAILLANMGAPVSESDMKLFLKRMFSDRAIITAPAAVRFFLSRLISSLRYKSSWKKYVQISGSPLYASMNAMRDELQQMLPESYTVRCTYSYSAPLIGEAVAGLYREGIKEITVITMYPQASYSTTGSVEADLKKAIARWGDIKVRLVKSYFDNPHFITFWEKLIQAKVSEAGYQHPYLLFSAHAIPQSFVERGDKYTREMETSARLIAARLGLPYSLAYQSKIGRMEWTRPYTQDHLAELHSRNINEIVIIPLSFINENLETKYDLDTEIIPYAKQNIKIKDICRVHLPASDSGLVKMFFELITQSNGSN